MVRLVRAEGVFRLPAAFQLIAASNPCPCGYLGDPEVPCTCSAGAIDRYRSKLAGPLIDRIDIVLEVSRPSAAAVMEGREGLSSADLRAMVARGREFRARRAERSETPAGASLEGRLAALALDGAARDLAVEIAGTQCLTARGITRLCRVARTIADMDGSERVGRGHLLEASLFHGRGAL